MKKTLTAALTASMLAAAVLAGCGQKAEAPAETTTEAAAEETTAEETTAEETTAEETEAEAQGVPAFEYTGENAYVAAICDYMKENTVKNYEPADVSIPAVDVIREDDSDENNIKVWCRIWLDNYALKGTTLMSRSGGNYAGRFDLKKDGDAYTVTAFDAVKDGSDSAPSEKAIFGIDDELMAGYQESDADVTDCRVDFAHMYAEANGITIEAIQDFGWDPIQVIKDKEFVIAYPEIAGDWETEDGRGFMTIENPEKGSTYQVVIEADQPDDTTLTYDLYSQYEMSTNTLYYWNGFMSQDGKDIENNGLGEEGSLVLNDDDTIDWIDGDKEPVTFKRAEE